MVEIGQNVNLHILLSLVPEQYENIVIQKSSLEEVITDIKDTQNY